MSSTTDTLGSTSGEPKDTAEIRRKFVNTSLISLKCLLFFFFGGMGCLLPFLPLHMLAVGLSGQEIRTISMIAPAVAILGPLIAGPLADRVASTRYRPNPDKQPMTISHHHHHHHHSNASNGRYLRVMIAVCCVFSVLFYSLLLVVPIVERIEMPHELRPAVKFSCDEQGAVVHQERCRDAIGCHRWSNEDQVGSLRLDKCNYACYAGRNEQQRQQHTASNRKKLHRPQSAAGVQADEPPASVIPLQAVTDGVEDGDDAVESSGDVLPAVVVPLGGIVVVTTTAADDLIREVRAGAATTTTEVPLSESPHVCYEDEAHSRKICHVFSSGGGASITPDDGLVVRASLRQAVNPEDANDWCAYPVAQYFQCRIPEHVREKADNRSCFVECSLRDPYDTDLGPDQLLAESQCRQVIGNEQLTFWMYLAIRSLADIFPTAALALIDAALVIATRETSTGRGDVGRQLAFGSLGFALFGPLSGYLTTLLGAHPSYYAPLGLHGLLVLMAACVALSADSMPLSPPEWWWHTTSGMLALPMSSVRKYGGETAALFVVLVVMGAFWSAIDTYLPIHLAQLRSDELSIGLALTLGALPAVLFLWKSEHLVDYCGHSNLLITAFIIYIVRFAGLSLAPNVWWALISESLELFTLGVMWVTAILYFRHLISRQMTTTGQALPVIAHFCLGRAIGAVIGACVDKIKSDNEVDSMKWIYRYMAGAAAVVATLYFAIYHGLLKPRCHTQTVQSCHRQPPTIVQAMNGNGNYTPLRVYHNGMGRKGQFRY